MTAQQAPRDGLIVVFEGIDGSGKTTQVQLAREALQTAGWPVQATRNLGGTPIGEALRKVIKSPLERPSMTNLYISVAIQEALVETIQTLRRQSLIVLMDRGPLSLAAYEVFGAGLDARLGWQHVDDGMAKLRPELMIIYRLDVKTALARARQKPGETDYFEGQTPDYFERVAEGYETAAKRYPKNTLIIDGSQTIEVIHAQTMAAIEQAITAKLAAGT